jgi:hypothetical protein
MEMDKNILMKPKQVTFLNFIIHFYTVISPHHHICGLHASVNMQVVL